MNRLDPTRKAGKLLAGAGLMLGMCMGPVGGALAVERPYRPCPPGYQYPSSPYYSPGAPSQGVPTPARPGDAPGAPRPGGMGDQGRGDQQQQQQPQGQDQAQQPTDFSQSADSSRANPAPGMNTPQLGRLDMANRLNLFDNMVAAPQNKVWYGFQYSDGINTGLKAADDFLVFFGGLSPADQLAFGTALAPFGQEQRQINHRVGAEVMLRPDTSIAVQGQYYTNEVDGSPFGDDFFNPQIMFKHVLARDCDTVVSATLGITPQTRVERGDFNENTTKFYPGMLYYETLSPDLFTQGGFQFGLPVREDQIYTFDWSLSLGYWLYRDCSLVCGDCCSNRGRITGIIPQVGLLGKHVLGDETRANAFGFESSVTGFLPPGAITPFTGDLFIYSEPRDVVDLTVGTLILIGCDFQVGLGYSLPITDDEVRESEFLSYVNYLF